MNEPHYINYISTDTAEMFTKAGLVPGEKWLSSTTKTLSFSKPAASK